MVVHMSVFDAMRIFPRFSLKRIKYFFYGIKWGIQRALYGYSDIDLWDLDRFYTGMFISTLNDFAKYTVGYPEKFSDEDDEVALKNWKSHINYVRSLFEDSVREYENPYQYYMDNMILTADEDGKIVFKNKLGSEEELEGLRQCYFEEEKKIYEKQLSLRRTALAELSDIYDNLWM